MTVVPVWRLYAYMDDDDDHKNDEHRMVADWQVNDVLLWCRVRGFDHILLTRTAEVKQFDRAPKPGVIHRFSDTESVDRGHDEPDGTAA